MFKNHLKMLLLICTLFTHCDIIKNPFSNSSDNKFPYKLTSSEHDFIPYCSPDGEHIAFLSLRNTYNPNVAVNDFDLWIMPDNGNNQYPIISKKLDGPTISVSSVSWFPDSYYLLVNLSFQGNNQIWKVSLDGKNKTRINFQHNFTNDFKLSPDGQKIAYRVSDQGSSNSRFYVANCDGTEPMLIEDGLFQSYT